MKKTLILMMTTLLALSVLLTGCGNETTESNQTKSEDIQGQENSQNQSDETSAPQSETFNLDFFSIVESHIEYKGEDGSARAVIVFDSADTFQIGEYTLSRTIYTGANTLQVYCQDVEIGEISFTCSPGNAVLKSGDALQVNAKCNPALTGFLLEKKLTCRTSQSYTVPTREE